MMNIKCLGGPRGGELLQVFGEISEPKEVLSLHDGNGGRAAYRITDEFAVGPGNLFQSAPRIYIYDEAWEKTDHPMDSK